MSIDQLVNSRSWSPTSNTKSLLQVAILVVISLLAGNSQSIFAVDQTRSDQWGLGTDQPVPGDYDGDARTDLAVFRPSEGCWYIFNSANATFKREPFGVSTDQPVAADYDGDGRIDIAVFRPSNGVWYYLKSSNGSFQFQQFGATGDIPVAGDFNGDGRSDYAVWRPSTGYWYTSLNAATNYGAIRLGQVGDIPVQADYDGDGKTDATVFRPSTGTFYIWQSSVNSLRTRQWGTSTDRPLAGDFDKDGKADIGVFRPIGGTWYVLKSIDSTLFAQPWGQSSDRLIPNDYDGNRQTDMAVFSQTGGIWNILLNPVPLSPSAPIIMGETNVLSTDDSGNGNLLLAQSATLSTPANLQSLSFYVTTAAGNLRLGVYDATGPSGGPGAKKAETNEFVPTVGWNTANVTTPVQIPAGTYWIAYLPSSNTLAFKKSTTAGVSGRLYSYAYGAMPATFSTAPSSTTSHWSFYAMLNGTPDTTPPVISAVGSSAISSSGATISWTTDEASDTQVEYGASTSYGSSTSLNTSMVTSHSASLSGLLANTLYHYRLKSRDAAGNLETSGDFTFTTAAPDTTPPAISSVASSAISSTGATITWTTNEASDTQVDYGATTSYGSSSTLNSSMVTSHGASLSGLSANTQYHYRVKSRDASGNLATSGDFTFTTAAPDTTPPVISAVSSSGISSSGATITWTTNEPSDTQVDYGTTTAYGSSSSLNPALVTSHSVSLGGLSANTFYHYRVKSRDAAGNLATSSDFTFTTLSSTCPGFVIEGFGANATGGCGGVSLVVDTLSNVADSPATTASGLLANKGADGRISFREALKVSGARIVTFSVSGNIDLGGGSIELENGNPLIYDNLTIDGSTAPNQGVQVINGTVGIRCNNFIIRDVRFRAGETGGSTMDSLRLDNASNGVVDHCTIAWGDDGDLDLVGQTHHITIQWSIIGPCFGSGSMLINGVGHHTNDITIHHNLFYQNNGNRAPSTAGGRIDFVNNVIYRNRLPSSQPGSFEALSLLAPGTDPVLINVDRNYFHAGLNEPISINKRPVYLYGDRPLSPNSGAWVFGNRAPSLPNETVNQDHIYQQQNGSFPVLGSRFNYPAVTTTSAAQAFTDVLANAGCRHACLDLRDTELLAHVIARTGGHNNSWLTQANLGGYPDLTRPCGQ